MWLPPPGRTGRPSTAVDSDVSQGVRADRGRPRVRGRLAARARAARRACLRPLVVQRRYRSGEARPRLAAVPRRLDVPGTDHRDGDLPRMAERAAHGGWRHRHPDGAGGAPRAEHLGRPPDRGGQLRRPRCEGTGQGPVRAPRARPGRGGAAAWAWTSGPWTGRARPTSFLAQTTSSWAAPRGGRLGAASVSRDRCPHPGAGGRARARDRGRRGAGTSGRARPARPSVRLEAETGARRRSAGALLWAWWAGITTSWGCADDVLALVSG